MKQRGPLSLLTSHLSLLTRFQHRAHPPPLRHIDHLPLGGAGKDREPIRPRRESHHRIERFGHEQAIGAAAEPAAKGEEMFCDQEMTWRRKRGSIP